ncbi:hypothetical protein [Cronobacter phage vB_Cdu_VP8]|nr:hypothetical protein [Cronobacter phage vB_Cdu_VP8]
MLKLNVDQATKIMDRYAELREEDRAIRSGQKAGRTPPAAQLQILYEASDLLEDHLRLAEELDIPKSEIVIFLPDDIVNRLQGWMK